MLNRATITIHVNLDKDQLPESITWSASDSSMATPQQAKAMLVSFWDGKDKTAFRLDLWTKEMMVDEMTDFFYQTLLTLADAYQRATSYTSQAADLRAFARSFVLKAREIEKQR